MNRARFRRAAEVFERALGAEEGADRDALLDAACGDDTHLRREVESLLAHHRPEETDRLALLRDAVIPRRGERADGPTRIGGYRIRRLIATGAMGAVYEAEQDDPQRVVALKVLRRGLARPALLRRFRHEAEFLGRLHHPNIAQVYEASTHDEGRPWFAMEYVAGRSLTDHAGAHQLDIRARLALVLKVCDAVQYAHEHGVIHRDLKPENILVDDLGEPRILDFGIARATDADLRVTTFETEVGALVGTLPYMSPEQVTAEARPDARSDVYALGVILYELLAGRLPLPLRGRPIPEAARIIREEDPSSLGAHDRELRGDLSTIAAKALEKDPARRYASARALAEDLRRFLREQPIVARPAGSLYQLHKFARRNPALVGGVVASFVLLLAGVLGTTWQLLAAREEAARASELNAFLTGTFAMLSPGEPIDPLEPPTIDGRLPPAESLLVDAANRLEHSFERWPGTRAELHMRIGTTFLGIGRFEEARHQLDQAVALRREHLGDEHVDTYRTRLLRCQILSRSAEPVLPQFHEAAEVARGLEHVPGATLRDRLAARLVAANARLLVGDADGAEREVRDVLGLIRAELPGDPMVFDASVQLGFLLDITGRSAEAEALLTPVIAEARELLDVRDIRRRKVGVRLSSALVNQGRYTEALVIASEATDLGRVHPLPALTLYDMRATNFLASALIGLGRLVEVEVLFRQRVAECQEFLGDHFYTWWARLQLSNLLRLTGRADEALAALEPVIADRTQEELEDERLAVVHIGIARAQAARGCADVAERHFRLGLEGGDRFGQYNIRLGYRRSFAQWLEDEGRHDEAEAVWRERVTILRTPPAHDRWRLGVVMKDLSRFLRERRAPQALVEAEALAGEAAAHLAAARGPGDDDTARARKNQAFALHELGRHDEAARLLAGAALAVATARGPGQWAEAWLRALRGRCLLDLGRGDEAELELLRAAEQLERTLGARHEATVEARGDLAEALRQRGRPDLAACVTVD